MEWEPWAAWVECKCLEVQEVPEPGRAVQEVPEVLEPERAVLEEQALEWAEQVVWEVWEACPQAWE